MSRYHRASSLIAPAPAAPDPFRNLREDLRDALEHASDDEGRPLGPGEFRVERHPAMPLGEAMAWFDYASWGEWGEGELADIRREGGDAALRAELARFRGPAWSDRAMGWIGGGMPAAVLVETPSGRADLGDGRGRISLAVGMGSETVPVAVATPRRAPSRRAAVEAWHGTRNLDFKTFSRAFTVGQLGFHFGTEEQATGLLGEGEYVPRVIRVELDVENPLRMPDLGGWTGHAAKAEFERALGVSIPGSGSDASIVRAIRAAGHDGVVYANRFEGKGDSYIVFDPSQIRIVGDTRTPRAGRPD